MKNTLRSGVKLLQSNMSDTPYVVLYVTHKCDLACPFCFNKETRSEKSDQTSIENYRLLSSSIRNPFEILISGGEPFLRDDLAEILKAFIRNSNPAVITIPTNGSQTKRIESVLKSLESMHYKGRLHLNLSVDAPGPEHDRIRGSENLHQRILDSAACIRSFQARNPNLWLGVISIIGDHNNQQFIPVIEWVYENIVPDIHDIGLVRDDIKSTPSEIVIQRYREIQKEITRYYKNKSGIEHRVYNAFLNYFFDSVQKGSPKDGCNAGKSILVVTTDGKVFPCEPFWISPDEFSRFDETCLGDLKTFNWDIRTLLKSENAQTIIQKIKAGDCACLWECALFANLLFTQKGWVRIARALAKRETRR